MNESLQRPWQATLTLAAFLRHAVIRFVADGCLTAAGALSYTTLVALVPIIAIAVAMLTIFPIFAEMRDQLFVTLFRNFVPEVGSEVEHWFRYFADTSGRTTTFGVAALAVTVILLLATIEDQLHIIWRVRSRRPWLQRILAYWAITTLGPLLLGVSFSLPGYLDLFVQRTGINPEMLHGSRWLPFLLRTLPFLLEAFVFTLVYELIPSSAVRWREAIVGGLVAASLLEVLKVLFALYVGWFSTYRAVYGALAAIPIFLLWMYVAWSVVLFGAVVAASMPRWRIDERGVAAASAIQRLGLALALLTELVRQARIGGSLRTVVLAARFSVAATAVDDVLGLLEQAGVVVAAVDGGWALARALDRMTLLDLYRALHLPVAATLREVAYPWREQIAGAVQRIAAAEADAMELPVSEILAVDGAQQAVRARTLGRR
jgi:membrane protein